VRLIAATNKNLELAVSKGVFRQDLLYRLNGFTIRLPPLRERCEDLPALIDYFIKHFNPALGKQVHAVSPDALRLLEEHPWPGNVRELQSTIKYALVHAAGDILTPSCLPENLRNGPALASPSQPTCDGKTLDLAQTVQSLLRAGESEIYRKVTAAADRIILESVLRHARGNQVQASELLGMSRTTLRVKLRGLGMTSEKTFMSDYDQDD
jgi:two-component system nitrogen regulation response regulator GlnG